MNRCGDCANYHNNRHRQCVAYNNEVSSKDDATHCCEFVNVKDNNTAIDYIAKQLKKQNSFIEVLKPKCSNDMPKEITCNCSKDAETLAKICETQTNQFVDSYIKNFDNHFDTSEIGFKKESRKPKIHELKILPEYFNEVQSHNKQFELRKDDRDYRVGDWILLKEFDNGSYTGRECGCFGISYILRNCPEYGLKEGYCIIGW